MEVPNITSLYQTIIESKAELAALAEDLWRHPELAWHEEYAVKRLSDFLRVHGFRVETGYLGFPTSFRAECGSGSEAAFAIAAEYDALPEIGHGCGHNLIAMAAMAAALAVKRGLDGGISGRVVILGTPAEESGGGKVKMLQKGCLDDIGAAMMVHPSWRTVPDKGSTAIRRYDVDFTGVEAHAATTPEEGVNALDAVMLLFAGVNAFRQQMPDNCRIHGIVSNGGSMPNIIPGSARCRFYLRSSDEAWIERLDRRFLDIVAGAELMTGAKAKITRSVSKICPDIIDVLCEKQIATLFSPCFTV